jgi:hypothetical protein
VRSFALLAPIRYPVTDGLRKVVDRRLDTDREYVPFRVVGPREDFGAEDLRKDRVRKYAAIMTQPGYVIRIDTAVYSMTINWICEAELAEKTNYLKGIPELHPLNTYPELYERLAETMARKELPRAGHVDFVCGGWMILVEGLIARRRVVDFSKARVLPHLLEVGDVRISLPEGKLLIQTDKLEPKHLIADPSLSKSLNNPFTLSVLEDSVVYALDYQNVHDLLPIDIRREIEKLILNDPGDVELISEWVETERAKQWGLYRNRVGKEARKYVKHVKREENGTLSFRRVKPPKTLKGVESPRQRFKAVSPRLFTETGNHSNAG